MNNSGKENRKKKAGKSDGISNGVTTIKKLHLIFSPEHYRDSYKQEKQS